MKKLPIACVVLLLCVFGFAAAATPTSVASIAVASGSATVSSTAHGLSAGQGFCINGSAEAAGNVCGVVAAVPTADTFTFSAGSSLLPCGSTCGTVSPAKQLVVLDVESQTGTVNFACWLTTQAPHSTSQQVSAWSGASAAENAAIAAGYFIEARKTLNVGNPQSMTLAQMRVALLRACSQAQAQLTSAVQPGAYYGAYFDGTGWSQ